MIKMGMHKKKVYYIIVAALICQVLTFNILEDIKQLIKLSLIYKKVQKELDLENYKTYTINKKAWSILNSEKESLINAASSWLAPGICTANMFHKVLVNLPESQFDHSPDLSNE